MSDVIPKERLLTIDGKQFDVMLTKIDRTASIADTYAKRTMDGVLHRDIIGCYVNYSLSFHYRGDPEKYDELWQILVEEKKSHTFKLPANIGYTTAFDAYVANVKDSIEYANPDNANERTFTGLSCDLVAMRPNLSSHRR